MNEDLIRQQLRAYIVTHFVRDANYPLGDDEGIITGGLMDSFALAELAIYIEDSFGVYIPDPDLTVAKMDTLNQMVARILHDGD